MTVRSRIRRPGVLVDRRLDLELGAEGFVVVDLLSRSSCDELRRHHAELRPTGGSGFEPDLTNPDPAYRREVARRASAVAGPAVAALAPGHRRFLWNFLCKWPGDRDDLYLHRDWMFVDEPTGARAYIVWVALTDIERDDGALKVLPRSHELRGPLAGTDLAPDWLRHRHLLEDHLLTVPMRAGQAMVMDHGVVHGSHPNRSDEVRLALGCGLHRASDALCHFRRTGDGTAVRYEVDDDFFVTHTPAALMAAAPTGYPGVTVAFDEPSPGADEFLRSVADLSVRRGGLTPRGTLAWRRRAPGRRASTTTADGHAAPR